MPSYTDQQLLTGSTRPTTIQFDIGRLYQVDVSSQEFKELLVRLYQAISDINNSLTTTIAGYYLTEQFVTGALYFGAQSLNQNDLRPVFRKVITIGALPAGITTVAHGLTITSTWSFVQIYGAASNTTTFTYYPLPFASAGGAANIEVRVNATNVIVTNNSGTTFDVCRIVLEYLQN